jgi:hypothetical protein
VSFPITKSNGESKCQMIFSFPIPHMLNADLSLSLYVKLGIALFEFMVNVYSFPGLPAASFVRSTAKLYTSSSWCTEKFEKSTANRS